MCIYGEETECSKRKSQKDREWQRTGYYVEKRPICRKTFIVGNHHLDALINHYKKNGLVPRSKKSSFKRSDILLLPSAHTKTHVYQIYKTVAEEKGDRVVSATTFRNIWNSLMPNIRTCRPMTDLCFRCQSNMTIIFKSTNLGEEVKGARLKQQENHLTQVHEERALYQAKTQDAKLTCQREGIFGFERSAPYSRLMSMHYSFDYAQQVHLPSNPMQPGPIYFLVPRKCGLFGVCCKGIPKQVNFLIDEAHCITKGSNAVVSYLDYFFEHFGLGETHVHLHCDNCTGQNNNKFVLWYFAWRVVMGFLKSIELDFMPTGHTKFSCDQCFGLVKQAFKRHVVSTLDCMASVVDRSASCNQAQLVGTADGRTIVPVCQCQKHFEKVAKPLNGIKSQQHFRFDSKHPGTVFYRHRLSDRECSFQLFPNLNKLPCCNPPVIPPPGLSYQRKEYLFKQIRQFIVDPNEAGFADIMCPDPRSQQQKRSHSDIESEDED
ncbi:hypothetical protein CAPTEDRAFT_217262 [Capitella teleta]|uniref:DUF7869 domain-containing protein n=1 Tax=Capitella teleta TaxID=283909 RepID=R7T897_CAPTE|nr:hypothetical protein CAPTEDRAFT_217262 [Capitella teleta]|eukprot:ELT89668.1 hypothetical protein CAPTEDRAFT_217262 [Capitella teleta]